MVQGNSKSCANNGTPACQPANRRIVVLKGWREYYTRSSEISLAIGTSKPRDELTLFKDENEVQKKGGVGNVLRELRARRLAD